MRSEFKGFVFRVCSERVNKRSIQTAEKMKDPSCGERAFPSCATDKRPLDISFWATHVTDSATPSHKMQESTFATATRDRFFSPISRRRTKNEPTLNPLHSRVNCFVETKLPASSSAGPNPEAAAATRNLHSPRRRSSRKGFSQSLTKSVESTHVIRQCTYSLC